MNESEIKSLLERGTAEVLVKEEFEALLKSGRKLRLKEGFDPSAPDIHLGHMVTLRKLRQFQDLGHQVVLIVGDWTAQIGDPTGVSVTRPMLTAKQVKENAETYMQQFFKIVDIEKTEVRWQSEWFSKFGLEDVIKLTSKFTIAQFLAREDFKKRFAEERPISITEFLYPLMQAYDSLVINSDVEFGGTDQKFNLLVGRELQEANGLKPQQILLVPILTGTDGVKKMSKSLGNYIGVAEPPEQIFGKLMSIPDESITNYFELLTDISEEELNSFKEALEKQAINPMELKKCLAKEIITQLYDAQSAASAAEHFKKVVQNKELPDEIAECKVSFSELCSNGPETDISKLITIAGLVKSRSEASRLIKQGAVSVNGTPLSEINAPLEDGCIIKVGKRRFAKIINSDSI